MNHTVFGSMVRRADAVIRAEAEQRHILRETPLYPYPAGHAREHGEPEQYRTSRKANIACKEAIQAAINDRKGHFVLISKEENRDQPLKRLRRSVKKDLQKAPVSAAKKSAPKRREPER